MENVVEKYRLEMILILTKTCMPELLVRDLRKIDPPGISGIYSSLTATDDIVLELYIVGKTFREHYQLSDMTKTWYDELEPEFTDYSVFDRLGYREFNEILQTLLEEDNGLISYRSTNDLKTLFTDFFGAYIHNVITIKLNFGNNKYAPALLRTYPKIMGELE